jgi:hypothetical protein
LEPLSPRGERLLTDADVFMTGVASPVTAATFGELARRVIDDARGHRGRRVPSA